MNTIKRNIYKYNLSFYYRSTIIYLVVFIAYVIIRGEFIEGKFELVTKDPIMYFFGVIIFVSIMAIIYNLYKNRYLEVSDNKISFVNKFRTKTVAFNQIDYIKLFKEREGSSNRAFRLIRIRIKNRMRPIIIRPNDYENENDLIKEFQDIKSKLESGNV